MMTIAEFCQRHGSPYKFEEWALANCRDMAHAWETLQPDWLIWVATRPGVLDDRTLRLFAVWSARQVQHLMPDPRSIAALYVAERYANGQATDQELAAAYKAAYDAARDAGSDAASDAASAAALSALDPAWLSARAASSAATLASAKRAAWTTRAARDAASEAAGAAAWAARTAAWLSARAAAWAAASEAAGKAQADWLRANAKPCFNGGAK